MGTKKFNFNEVLKFMLALYSVISCSPNQQLYIHNSFSLRKQPFLLALRRWYGTVPSGEEQKKRMFSQATTAQIAEKPRDQ